MGRSCYDKILRHVAFDGVELCLGQCPLAKTIQDGMFREAHVLLHHWEGYRLPVWIRVAPIRDGYGEIIGAVELFTPETGLSRIHQELHELRHIVLTDHLTKVGNRLYLERKLRGLIAEYEGQEKMAGIVFVDIDHFKQINDNYGHHIGDKILCMVATTLKYNIRANDVVGRWGGEEFVVILYDVVSPDGLMFICEKLRVLVRASTINLEGKGSLGVTISIGATLLLPTDTPETIIQRSDKLMYKSKQAGRNRVTIG